MPQFDHPAGGAQVLDVETAVNDAGILGSGGCGGGATLDEKVDLRRMIDDVESAGDVVPGVFICPISLSPMTDPVTLCTGQTYDRSNILRWLAVRRTCPTTMQELWDDSLTPNSTLQQLISAWFSRRFAALKKRSADVHGRAGELLQSLRSSKGQSRLNFIRDLRRLLAAHPSLSKTLTDGGAAGFLSSLLGPFTSHALGSEAVAILAAISPLDSDSIGSLNQPAKISLLVDLLNDGSIETKLSCTRLIEYLLIDPNFRVETLSSLRLFAALLRLAKDKRSAASGLSLLRRICAHKQVRPLAVGVGAVPQLIELLPMFSAADCVESALQILDDISAIPQGRSALKECSQTIPTMVKLLMRVSEGCTHRALSILLAVCKESPEECAAVAVEAGLAAKLLLVIQSGCSAVVKQKAAELLKLCSLNYTATLFISKCKLTRTIQ